MKRLLFVMLVACGGRVGSASMSAPDAGSNPPPSPTMERLGVCENRIEYSNDPSDATTRVARFGYDAAGRLVRYLETARGVVFLSLARSYDPRGSIHTQDEHFANLPPNDRHFEWTFDDMNRFVSLASTTNDGTGETRREYDDQSRIRSSTSRENGVVQFVDTWSYPDAGTVDVETEYMPSHMHSSVRYAFSGGWLVSIEMRREGILEATETYTYSDLTRGEVATRVLKTDGTPDASEHYTWENHRLVRADYDDGPNSITRNDFTYDDAGRLATKRWFAPNLEWLTTFTWQGSDLVRVERRDRPSNVLIERWSIARECAGSLELRIAPMIDWQRELQTLPFQVDRASFFSSYDAL